jgi:1,4-alpha-glucan branching enzyme
VSLVGDFNSWDKQATPLSSTGVAGVWSVSLPLPAGRHEYAFIITGADSERWAPDPATLPVRDELGTETSVITLAGTYNGHGST